jgi:hypothetical protein
MRSARPRTERRRKQREVAKKLDRALRQTTAAPLRGKLDKVPVPPELDEWAGPTAVAKARRYEQGDTHGIRQEED